MTVGGAIRQIRHEEHGRTVEEAEEGALEEGCVVGREVGAEERRAAGLGEAVGADWRHRQSINQSSRSLRHTFFMVFHPRSHLQVF